MLRKFNSITYVNFSPYENTGNILDYLIANFKYVALFSFSFHNLGKDNQSNQLILYQNGKVIITKKLFDFQVPESLIFLLLPFRSFLIFLQLLYYSLFLKNEIGEVEYYFTVNAFTAWSGHILKKCGFYKKTVFWVWDYYPPKHKDPIIRFMRWLYWKFDKTATQSDTLVFLNQRVRNLHVKVGAFTDATKYKIIPIGTNPMHYKNTSIATDLSIMKLVIVGVTKKSQGLDHIFDRSENLAKVFPKLELHVVGTGPDLEYFKERASGLKIKTIFYGHAPEHKLKDILNSCHVGIATYTPGRDNVSYYGDPSKIKLYLSLGLPVIATDVFEFCKEINIRKAGIIIDYFSKNDLLNGLKLISNNYKEYSNNALKLSKKFDYKKIYTGFFN